MSTVKRKPTSGEIVQIDSTLLVNLPMFSSDSVLSPEVQEIKRQLLAAMGNRKLRAGEIVQVDSSLLCDLSVFKGGA